jgi:dephospho-CoA kinase
MITIGLTGGIGSGKTTVARLLIRRGAALIDADKVGHEALLPASPVSRLVVDAFGREILLADGGISRQALGRIVFSSPEKLARLNKLVHPWMYATMQRRLAEFRGQDTKVVVLDAAILIEAGWASLVDEVWVTVASRATIIKRLNARGDGLSEGDVLNRIRRQMTNEERIKYANVIINTDGSLSAVTAAVDKQWDELIKRIKVDEPVTTAGNINDACKTADNKSGGRGIIRDTNFISSEHAANSGIFNDG